MTPSFLSSSLPPASCHAIELATLSSEVDCQFEQVSQTILRLQPASSESASGAVSPHSAPTLVAMQHLVEMIRKLRSPANGWPTEGMTTPDSLLPYVSEEAYDVLDTLTGQASDAGSNAAGREQPPSSVNLPLPATVSWPMPSLVQQQFSGLQSVEALIPQLLWQIAQSSYTVMQLIEGICVCCCSPAKVVGSEMNSDYQVGMLRLVVLLEVEAPTIRWCFDLATSRPPMSLLTEDTLIVSDEIRLLNQSGLATDPGHRVESLLQGVLQQIDATAPTLIPLLKGIPIELLQPGANWQSGTLQLRLGFEFTAQAGKRLREVIPAELADIAVSDTHDRDEDTSTTLTPPEETKSAPYSPGSATMVRLADSALLQPFIQVAIQQALVKNQPRFDQPASQPEQQLLSIVTAAYETADRVDAWLQSSLTLYQPELLLDEFVPKLLWRITRSSYAAMQLLGGVEAKILQPQTDWQTGTLRLVATLKLMTAEMGWSLDLAKGWPSFNPVLSPDPESVVVANTISCQQPTLIASISETLLQTMHDKVPELELLLNGMPVEWIEAEQEWQACRLWLDLNLEFMADSD